MSLVGVVCVLVGLFFFFHERTFRIINYYVELLCQKYYFEKTLFNPPKKEVIKESATVHCQIKEIKGDIREKDNYTLVSPIEGNQPSSHFVFIFNGILDCNKLLTSLKDLINIFPEIGSSFNNKIKLSKQDENLLQGRNKEIIVYDFKEPKVEVAIVEHENLQSLINDIKNIEYNKIENINLEKEILSKKIEKLGTFKIGTYGFYYFGQPLCRIQITFLKESYNNNEKNGLTLISISNSHSLCDAIGIKLIMNCWSKLYQNQSVTDLPNRDRKLLFIPKKDLKDVSYNHLESKLSYFNAAYYRIINKKQKIISNEIEITKEFLFKKKENLQKKLQNNEFISTNDMICALLWKCMAIGMDVKDTTILRLRIIVDLRERYSKLTNNLFANALTSCYVGLTRKELLEMSILEISQYIRKEIERYTKGDSGEQYIKEMNKRYFDNLMLDYGFPKIEDPSTCLVITNWSKINFINSFGENHQLLTMTSSPITFPHFVRITSLTNNNLLLSFGLLEKEYHSFIQLLKEEVY
ncbi:hypothetical protein ABK040_002393 [Willaertia magna]